MYRFHRADLHISELNGHKHAPWVLIYSSVEKYYDIALRKHLFWPSPDAAAAGQQAANFYTHAPAAKTSQCG